MQYETIREEVLADFLVLAEDSWRRVLIGSTLTNPSITERAVITQLLQKLNAGEGKEAFIEAYMKAIRKGLLGPPEKFTTLSPQKAQE